MNADERESGTTMARMIKTVLTANSGWADGWVSRLSRSFRVAMRDLR
jgi:hypothetical protein